MQLILGFTVVRAPELGGSVLETVELPADRAAVPAELFRQHVASGGVASLVGASRQVVLDGLADYKLAGQKMPPIALLGDDGRIRFVPFIPLSDASVQEVEDSARAGYLTGDPHHWIVDVEVGWGGSGGNVEWLISFLSERGVNIAIDTVVVAALATIGRRARRKRVDRAATRAALVWAEQRGLSSPEELRCWLDLKDKWSWSEVSERLGVGPDTAKALLLALGYETDASGAWRLGFSADARARRASWLKAELRGT